MSQSPSFPPSEPVLHSIVPDSSQPRRFSRRTLFTILAALVGISVLCVILIALTIGRAVLSISSEQTAIAPVLDRFMKAMAQRDPNDAYRLFSSRAQRQTPTADLAQLLDGPNYVLFDGYQSISIDSTNLTNMITTNTDEPQGTVAKVSGTVTYAGGVTGSFQATLEKENGDWRLFFIHVTVPPEKMKPSS